MEDWRVAVPKAQSGVNDTAGPTRYHQVLLGITRYQQEPPVISYIRFLPFPIRGKAGYVCTCPFLIRGKVLMYHQVPSCTRYLQRLPFPIRGKARYIRACTFPIREQAISVPLGTSVICLPLFGAKSGTPVLLPSLFGGK